MSGQEVPETLQAFQAIHQEKEVEKTEDEEENGNKEEQQEEEEVKGTNNEQDDTLDEEQDEEEEMVCSKLCHSVQLCTLFPFRIHC